MENFFGRDEQQRKTVPPGTRRGHGELDIFKLVGANAPPYTGKLGGRDSIKTKLFEEVGIGLERGRGKGVVFFFFFFIFFFFFFIFFIFFKKKKI